MASGHTPYIYIQESEHEFGKKRKYKKVELADLDHLPRYRAAVFTTDYQGDIIDGYPKCSVDFRTIDRTDPVLVSIVEAIGRYASGPLSRIEVVDIQDGTEYIIDKYDGLETIVCKDEVEWNVASANDLSETDSKNINAIWDFIKPPPPISDLAFLYDEGEKANVN
jgi:hypothetical protein